MDIHVLEAWTQNSHGAKSHGGLILEAMLFLLDTMRHLSQMENLGWTSMQGFFSQVLRVWDLTFGPDGAYAKSQTLSIKDKKPSL